MYDAPSPATKAIASAISSGVPYRRSGIFSRAAATVSASSSSVMPVAIHPGATAFTRMPCGASSTASERANMCTAALVAL